MKKNMLTFVLLLLMGFSQSCYCQLYVNAAFGFQNSTQLTADHKETLTQHLTDEMGSKISYIFPRFKKWQNSALELQVGGLVTSRMGAKPDGSSFRNEVLSVPILLNARQPRMKDNGEILWEAVLGLGYFQDFTFRSDYSTSSISPKGGLAMNLGLSFYFDEFLKMDLNFSNLRPLTNRTNVSDINPPSFSVNGFSISLSSNLNNLIKRSH